MIPGKVNTRGEAIVPLRVRGPGGPEMNVEAVVDTGFTASLTLPSTVVDALGLIRQSNGGAILADGSVRQITVFSAEIDWEGSWRPVLALAVGEEVLIRMRLLEGHELRIAVIPGGDVEITPLP